MWGSPSIRLNVLKSGDVRKNAEAAQTHTSPAEGGAGDASHTHCVDAWAHFWTSADFNQLLYCGSAEFARDILWEPNVSQKCRY